MSALREQHTKWVEANRRLTGAAVKSDVPTLLCPCCGQEIEGNVATKALALVPLTPARRKMLNRLCHAFPSAVLGGELEKLLWEDKKHRPSTRKTIIAVHTHGINQAIKPYGWAVQGAYLDAGSRRLVRVKPATKLSTGLAVDKSEPKLDHESIAAV